MASIPQAYRFERYQIQGHIREFNSMFSDKRKKVREHYKEYNGGYLGHYAKWVIVFSSLGFFGFCASIAVLIENHYQT